MKAPSSAEMLRRESLLNGLKAAVIKYKPQIDEALKKDLGKSSQESYLTEISFVLNEIELQKKNMRRWARPQAVKGTMALPFSKSYKIFQPYGRVLIIAPWNYPFQLLLAPLAGAISAGNTVVLKPSPAAPATGAIVERMISECFREEQVAVVQGGAEALDKIMEEDFDFIFYTGGPLFGKEIMKRASASLTPVCLELGGKSPCIVGPGTKMHIAARRIVFGKFLNAGQTCVAPDYILVTKDQKEALIEALRMAIRRFYGKDPRFCAQYSRIIHQKATERLIDLLRYSGGEILWGGNYCLEDCYMSPSLVLDPRPDSRLMQEEIFGPILPIVTVSSLEEAIEFVNKRPRPLALYYFGHRSDGENVLECTASGGACINDTIMHVANPYLPFGGLGQSGMGAYHGSASFYTFSHSRSIVSSSRALDISFKYPPYRWFKILRRLV